MSSTAKNPVVLIGTYTEHEGSQSKGIYLYRMESSSGELRLEGEVQNVHNPSYLAVHPHKGYLYAVNEMDRFGRQDGGGVSAFAIDAASPSLLNSQVSHGAAPCYISIERTGRFAMVANYQSGSVAMFPIQPDGSLAPASDLVQHSGASVHPERQTGPHAHCIVPDPMNRFAIAADLGADKLFIYKMDLERGKLPSHGEKQLPGGSGPRHLIFHPGENYVYVINELDSTLSVYRFDPEAGSLEAVQAVPTLPEGYRGRNLCADLHISGHFLFASNRGHDSIVWYRIDENTGQLSHAGHISSGGSEPRGFAIDPSGSFLLAANQNSNNIVTFGIDAGSGRLVETGAQVHISMPVCVKFAVSGS